MMSMTPTLDSDAADIRAELLAGSLAGFGPITLTAGACPDAELVAKVLLADLDHVRHLREHTGREASADRWAAIAADLQLLLAACRERRSTTAAPAASRTA